MIVESTRESSLKSLCIALAATALVSASSARAEEPKPWSYEDQTGPEHWGEGAVDCRDGKHQSPIDLVTVGEKAAKVSSELPPIVFQWSKSIGHLINKGHALQVNFENGNSIQLGDAKYDLTQMNFHAPSEHTVDGKHAALEVHFVHKNPDGVLAVVSVLVDTKGAANKALAVLFKAMDKPVNVEINLPALLPEHRGYFRYEGSLTTPPCAEQVQWLVLQQHLHTRGQHVRHFRSLFKQNARPTQALNDRVVASAPH